MRHPTRPVPAQPITHLWERHKEIARRLVSGERQADICRSLGISAPRLSIINRSPAFVKYLDSLSARADQVALGVKEQLEEGAKTGVALLYELMTKKDSPDTLKTKIATEFLDRAGYGKTTNVKVEQTHVFDTARIEELKEKRKKMLEMLPAGIIDVTPEPAA